MLPEGFRELDFDTYHQQELPRLIADGNGLLALGEARKLGSIAFSIEGGAAYTYAAGSDGVEIIPGDEKADVVIELDRDSWQRIVHEIETGPGLLYSGKVRCLRGKAIRLVSWEPGLRALYNGRPIFDPKAPDELLGLNGEPLDPGQAFAIKDDPEEMAHFLRTTGYLIVRNVFSAAEVARFRDAAEALRGAAMKGDRKSWWGKNAAGEEVLTRVTHARAHAAFQDLYRDPRLTRLIDLADTKLVPQVPKSGEGTSIIYKNSDMTEGLGDLPWHRDCGMGGHALKCPLIILSVFVTPINSETGELRMLPGSWRGSCAPISATDPRAPRGVSVAGNAGDVSLHYGDVMHAGPPPTKSGLDTYRISAITAYAQEQSGNFEEGRRRYNDVLLGREDGQVEHLTEVVKRR